MYQYSREGNLKCYLYREVFLLHPLFGVFIIRVSTVLCVS